MCMVDVLAASVATMMGSSGGCVGARFWRSVIWRVQLVAMLCTITAQSQLSWRLQVLPMTDDERFDNPLRRGTCILSFSARLQNCSCLTVGAWSDVRNGQVWASYIQLLRKFHLWVFAVKSELLACGGVKTMIIPTTLASSVLVAVVPYEVICSMATFENRIKYHVN